MALAAEPVHLHSRHGRGITDPVMDRIARVSRGWAMTHLAAHTEFMRNDAVVYAERERTGGMACEAAQNAGRRIEDSGRNSRESPMAWRDAISVDRPVPGLAVFAIILAIHAAHESDRLASRAKGPISGLTSRGGRQGMSVRARRLRLILSRVAGLASAGARVVRRQRAHRTE